jgi:glucose/arabinose dehydrogenase
VPVGAPCNICEPDPDRYATITRLDVASGKIEVVARGVRNSVGFDWQPQSGELWFTDNGRDWMGDDVPPDELNRLARPGQHFGYPYCHGGTIADPEFGGRRCAEFVPPVQNLGAHVASLGMRFYTGKQFPERYRNAVFIAEHGSWNRSSKIGYRVSVVRLQGNRAVATSPSSAAGCKGEDRLGPPGRRAGDARRQPAGVGRPRRRDLPRRLSRQPVNVSATWRRGRLRGLLKLRR